MSNEWSAWGFWPQDQWVARQIQKLDQQLPVLKKLYFCYDPEGWAAFRAWVEKIAALEAEGAEWNLHLNVNARYDEYNEETDLQTNAEDAILTPADILAALVSWDNGEDHSPTNCSTFFK